MKKQYVILGLVNGIIISLVSYLLSDINPLAILIIPAAILLAEFVFFSKKEKSESNILYHKPISRYNYFILAYFNICSILG